MIPQSEHPVVKPMPCRAVLCLDVSMFFIIVSCENFPVLLCRAFERGTEHAMLLVQYVGKQI